MTNNYIKVVSVPAHVHEVFFVDDRDPSAVSAAIGSAMEIARATLAKLNAPRDVKPSSLVSAWREIPSAGLAIVGETR